MLTLDHIAVSGATLDAATDHVETALGRKLQPGGEHAVFHTHNALLGLEDALYLEAIAANPKAETPSRPRWFDLDRFEGAPRLTNWICRADDLDAAVARFDEAGQPVALMRGDLRWRMAVPLSGILPFDNLFPALMQWDVDVTPPDRLAPSGVRMTRLIVQHPWIKALSAMLEPVLEDDRITFREGPAHLSAEFETPTGMASL